MIRKVIIGRGKGGSKVFGLLGYVFLFLVCSNDSSAQWKKIFDTGDHFQSVYFKGNTPVPLDGFATNTPGALWRTLDGGVTWLQIFSSPSKPSCFTFKDAMNGWVSGYWGGNLCYTTDGGWNWTRCNDGGFSDGGIIYVKSTALLIKSKVGGKNAYTFSPDGINFQLGPILPGFSGGVSVTFSDDYHGILSSVNGSPRQNTIAYTSDGGLTWNIAPLYPEFYQPIGIPNTETFFAICESESNGLGKSGTLIHSDDGGQMWKEIYSYRNPKDAQVTGTMQYGLNMSLFFQTTPDGSEGIMMSSDSGNTFHSICGPVNESDTRFYVRDSFIYAGDKNGGLWLNTTGIGSNSTPQLSLTKITAPALLQCQTFDSLITLTFFDSCNGIQAKLASASISGSNSFSFSSPSAIPRAIHPNDSLIISYDPQTSQLDTAQLHLRFHLGWKDFDTTISLFGAGRIPKENVQFIPSLSPNAASAGAVIDLSVMPDKAISGRGLQSVSFDLNYNGDLLDESGRVFSTSIPGAVITVGAELPSLKTRHGASLPVTITGTDLTLDPKLPIADVKFQAMITDTTSTQVTLTNLKLNGGDPNYANCVLSADSSNTNFTEVFLCGDSTLYNYLRTGKLLDIISIRPNPAQDELEIDLQSAVKQDATVEIFDALGVRVFSDVRNIAAGSNSIHLDTKGLASGMYLVRVGGVSQSLVISR